jgi:predicted TIM-barrel fold metal-dependent hydrolase
MIIDSHAHFEPRMFQLGDMLQTMDRVGIDKIALIPSMNDPLPETPERLLWLARKLMQSCLTRPLTELIHRSTLTREGNLKLRGEVFQIYPRPNNQAVAEAVATHPARLLGWIFLNPKVDPNALEELERWRAVPGMIGIKLHPHWHDYRTELLWPVLARAEELSLPALIHLGFGPRGDYRDLCEKFPRLRIIAAHAGFPFYQDLWKFARDYPNLYVDLSSPYIDESLARAAVRALGPNRCLYGTDAPYGFHHPGEPYDYQAIKGWISRMPISSGEIERIFGENFAALLTR